MVSGRQATRSSRRPFLNLWFLEKQMRAATCGKRANPIRMRDLARFTFCYDQVLAAHGSPSDISRAGASPAIENWPDRLTPHPSYFFLILPSPRYPLLTRRKYASYSSPKVRRKVGSS